MIVKRNLNPVIVLRYIWAPLVVAVVAAAAAALAHQAAGTVSVAIPFAPVGTLGAALAIFVAIRNNASYARWWEARTLLANMQNNSRILARQLVAATDNAIAAGSGGGADQILAYRRELVLRIVAFSHLLRMSLREIDDWPAVARLVEPEEVERLRLAANPANLVLQTIAVRIKYGVRVGIVGQFDPITLEPNLAALNTWAAGCERIKHTPTPRQYDYFTRVAVGLFSIVLPFGLLSLLPPSGYWMVVALSVIISSVFIVLERVGAIVDTPFANANTDVPLSAVCTGIERDLREQLGDIDLPSAPRPVDGYLW